MANKKLGVRRNRLVKAALAECRRRGHDMGGAFNRTGTATSHGRCVRCVYGCSVDAARPDYPDGEPITGAAYTADCPGDAFAEAAPNVGHEPQEGR
jgi:hypothetical protein